MSLDYRSALCGEQAPRMTSTCGLFAPHVGPHRLFVEDVPMAARDNFEAWVWDEDLMWQEKGPIKVNVRRIR